MIGTEIFQDRARIVWSQIHSAQAHHAFDGFLPSFRRCALPGDAQHIMVFVWRVASSAFGDHQLVCYRNALLGRQLCRLCGRGSLRLLALRQQR